MTEMTETFALEVERVIPGSIDKVFDAWLDPDQLKRWMTPGPGMSAPRVTVDPKVGGRFHITMKKDQNEIPHDGEYRVIDRPNKLVFTWVSAPAGDTLVTVRFQKVSETSTKVVLVHERLATAQSRDGHQGGWGGILDALARAFA